MPKRNNLKFPLFIFFVFWVIISNGQDDNPFHFFKEEKEFTYGLNNRRSFILDDFSTIYGIYAGVAYGEKVKHVITFNSTIFFVGKQTPERVRLTFVGLSEEFYFFRKNKWAFCTYAHGGAGQLSNNSPLIPLENRKEWVFPTEWGLHTEYALWSWFNIRAGAGYRYLINKPTLAIDGAYVKIGATISPKRLFKESKN